MIEIIGAIVALGLLITVHETGHFIAARLFGVEIEKFSIGFGPKLFSIRHNKTDYRLSLIPLGGYVKMKGENPDEIVQDLNTAFKAKKWWQRAIIAFSGPFFNLVFAILILIISFSIGRAYDDQPPTIGRVLTETFSELQSGDTIITVNKQNVESWSQVLNTLKHEKDNTILIKRETETISFYFETIDRIAFANYVLPESEPIIGELAIGLPAYKAGLKENDRILQINNKKMKDWYDIRETIQTSEQDDVALIIQRNGDIFDFRITLEENVMDGSKILGITQKLPLRVEEFYSLMESVHYGFISSINLIYLNYYGLYKVLAKPATIKDNIGGPVMIFAMSKQTIQKGWSSILVFVAMISIVLMMMNLLPIPVLDGGHIFFCIIEGICRKPLSIKTQLIMQKIGLFILLLLVVFAFFNDINRILQRNGSIRQHELNYQE
jgi:regulator of sigma E protease